MPKPVRYRYAHSRPRIPGALGQQLRRLAGWAIASSLGAAIGCSADQTMAGADGPGFAGAGAMPPAPKKLDTSGPDWQIVPCDALLLATDPIHPAQALDYFGVLGPKYLGANVLISDYGVACMGAADREQCLERLKQLTLSTALCEPPAICKSFTVSTRGDLVERQDDLPSLRALFGEIDTPSEAAVVAMTQGLMLACGDVEAKVGTRVQTTASGYRVYSEWDQCGASLGVQTIDVRRDGTTGKLDSSNYARSNCAIGRRPQGLELAQLPRDCAPLATFLANAAQLEAASVSAFARLGHELQQLGAAPSLLAATRRSAGDEVRHAQLTATLARSYGGTVRAPHVTAPAASRGAFEIALENAVEGCVRETFGALIAWHQAAFARDPSVAAIMRGIAADETRHAELSWKIAQWLEPQLSEGERRLLAAAREQAVRQLECEIRADTLPAPAREQIGMPTQAVQRALTDRMAATLGLS